MKSKFYFPVLFFFIFFQTSIYAVHSQQSTGLCEDQLTLQQTIPLDRSQLEAQLGRHLKFKERIGLSLLKSTIAKNTHQSNAGHATAGQGETDGFAIAGFVIGLVSLFIAGIPLGIVAIVFSIIATGRIKKNGSKGRGFAIAGLVLGLVGVIGAIVLLGTT